ncbi:hypothetical protein MYSTI_07588 [Myxococcus stipitatus DSM 14675]|uniref:Lipoprotein n=1 Tax=Myxococcus stipitatus (strain DSM 14675 / JCM 12634 / Mx s8) TaxID=1278073 RepID=L7ULR7_MYXSD|nr:hypothetical protein [Myxococcus stipitatus]AGC48860.1 hypothetical protein MYSTI_07588 [Myxococcus stipitatus DSM 14675]
MRRSLLAAVVVLLSALALTSTFDVSAGSGEDEGRGPPRAPRTASAEPRDEGDEGPVVVTCPLGLSQASYMPGLSERSKAVTVAGATTLSNCVTIPASEVKSASLPLESSLHSDFSCADLLTPRTVRQVVRWNTGETSTLVFSESRELAQGALTVFTLTGTVESGAFARATAIWTVTYLNSDIEKGCASPGGLIWLSGPSTLELIRTVT